MSKTVTPFVPTVTATSRQEEVDALLEQYPDDIDLPATGDLTLKLLMASLLGQIKFSPSEIVTLTNVMRKTVPDAPKRIKVETKIAPEKYLEAALNFNEEAFNRMTATAKALIPIVEAKTLAVNAVLRIEKNDGE